MKAPAICLILLGMCIEVKAQTINVKGVVVDGQQNPIEFASVFIKQSSSGKPLNGYVTDNQGKFKLSVNKAGAYHLQIAVMGYKTLEKDIQVQHDVNLNSIVLEDAVQSLASVSIVSHKPLVTKKNDRYIVNVAGNSLTTGKSSIDLFALAPGIFVSNNTISINGNASTRVMVDGRLLKLDNAALITYLSGLKADQISSIEVIPHPSAAYDAEGTGGLINIILKRDKSEGLNGSVTLGYQQPVFPSYYGNGALNYRDKRWELYANYSYSKSNSKTSLEDIRLQHGNAYNSAATIKPENINNNFQLGTGYDISTNQFIGIEFNGSLNNTNTSTISSANINDALTPLYRQINGDFHSKVKSNLYDVSFNYRWNTDTIGSVFKILADYVYNPHNSDASFNSIYTGVNNDVLLDSIYRNTVSNNIKNFALSADFDQNFKDKSGIKTGVKFTNTKTSNDILYEDYSHGNYTADPTQSNNYSYRENITAAYGEYDTRWLQTDVEIGIRGELTNTQGATLSGSAFVSDKNYFNLFPTVFLQHTLSKASTLSFNFGRRIDRPTFNTLNPFQIRVDDYTYISGNPNLDPEYTDTYDLSYAFHGFNADLFIYSTHNVFDQLLVDNGSANNVLAQYQWTNLNTQHVYGLSFYLPVQITNWWNTINSLVFVRNVYDFNQTVNEKTFALAKTQQSFTLKNDFTIDLSGFYQSAYNMGNLTFKPNYYVDFGINKSFSKNKYSIKLGISDVFNTSKADYATNSGALELTERQKYTTRQASLEFTYRLGGNKDSHTKKIESGDQDEKERMH